MLQTKDALFECLAAQDGFISGELLAERLGVSRSAVWKAVGELRAEGCRIEAAQNRGYALRDPGSRLSAGRIQALLRGRAADCRVLVERAVESTNDELKRRAAAGCPTGTVLVAEQQTGGKGRLGRSFYSPPRGGLYMSLLLRPALPASECMAVTACTAVAVAAAAEQICGRRAEIKWVNDIMMDGKKLCGILTEGALSAETGLFDYLVVGIGVNVASAGFPEELREVATSMFGDVGNPPRDRVAAAILNLLFEKLETLPQRTFMDEYRARSCVIGREITMTDFSAGGEQVTARALDVDDDGGLVVETASGVRTLHSGEVSVRVRKSKEEQSE